MAVKSESMQKSTKIALLLHSGRLVSIQTLRSFLFERSVRFQEKTWKTVSSTRSILQAKNRVEIHYDSLDSRFKITALEKQPIAKILSLTRRWPKYIIFLELQQSE